MRRRRETKVRALKITQEKVADGRLFREQIYTRTWPYFLGVVRAYEHASDRGSFAAIWDLRVPEKPDEYQCRLFFTTLDGAFDWATAEMKKAIRKGVGYELL